MGKLSLALVLCVAAVYSQAATPKITEGIRRQLLVPGATPKVVVVFKSNAVVHSLLRRQTFAAGDDRAKVVVNSLKAFAESTQSVAIEILKANPKTASSFRSFWITNSIIIEAADAATINHMISLNEVVEVREPKIAHINPVVMSKAAPAPLAGEWGVEIINADDVHASGNTGQGVRVASIDTGVRYTHEALRANYLDTAYSWHDPYSGSANPIDQNGHGTHTMGTIAGLLGIGVAPGAKWLACRGCDTSSCTESALLECGEFLTCPNQANCDGSKPHVVNNSWGGGQGDPWYNDVIDAWIAANIVPVFSNGNDGSYCGTANSPADYVAAIGVGSTDSSDTLSYFSSRGPTVDDDIKPDISAPGSDVRSSYYLSDTSYSVLSGTSMAGPHVAGAVALLLSGRPTLNLQQVKDALYDHAERTGLGNGGGACDGLSESFFPNHSYGHGRIDILKSVNSL